MFNAIAWNEAAMLRANAIEMLVARTLKDFLVVDFRGPIFCSIVTKKI